MNYNLDNKVVLVTGASCGIGRETAVHFAAEGAKVIVHYNTNEDAANETLALMKGDKHIKINADLTNPELVKELIENVIKSFGKIDILVNNAGIYEEYDIENISYEKWQKQWNKTISTNLMGAANLSFCAAQFMIKNSGGKIINVSSRGAFRGEPNTPDYAASKAAMNAMGGSMARALGNKNVFVYTVAPGFVETEMSKKALESDQAESILNQSPLERVAKPSEIAKTILFLASEGVDYLSGCIIDVNGASYLRT